MIAVMFFGVMAVSASMTGDWDCTTTNVVAAALRTQNGDSSVGEMKPEAFRYGDFSFSFTAEDVVIRLREGEQRKEQRASYFRQNNYLTFNFDRGSADAGGASPITFWTNEASSGKARYEVSFPTVSIRVMKTMSGHEVHLGDAAMAVAALSCLKRSA